MCTVGPQVDRVAQPRSRARGGGPDEQAPQAPGVAQGRAEEAGAAHRGGGGVSDKHAAEEADGGAGGKGNRVESSRVESNAGRIAAPARC